MGVSRASITRRIFPNYGVFDEFRYFHTGKLSPIIQMGEARIGISICEDIWYPDGPS